MVVVGHPGMGKAFRSVPGGVGNVPLVFISIQGTPDPLHSVTMEGGEVDCRRTGFGGGGESCGAPHPYSSDPIPFLVSYIDNPSSPTSVKLLG